MYTGQSQYFTLTQQLIHKINSLCIITTDVVVRYIFWFCAIYFQSLISEDRDNINNIIKTFRSVRTQFAESDSACAVTSPVVASTNELISVIALPVQYYYSTITKIDNDLHKAALIRRTPS